MEMITGFNVAGRENMSSQWYAGPGGGSPEWENVEAFWDYATKPRDPQQSGVHGEIVETIFGLDIGGIVQTRSGRFDNTDERYSHNLLLVEKSTLLLAQNTPDCFVYYSDLADVDNRFFNPRYLIE
nr:amidase domain-containing protein [Desulfosporosinus lacus]